MTRKVGPVDTPTPDSFASGVGIGDGVKGGAIVDSHAHVWDPARLSYRWLDGEPLLGAAHLPGSIAEPEVSRVIFVQADADDSDAEVAWIQSLASEWPQLAGIVAFAPVERAELPRVLNRLEALPLFVGVRRLLQEEPGGFIESDQMQRGLAVLAARRIPFDACIRHQQLPELVRALQGVAGLRVVLDHLGKPPVKDGITSDAGREWCAAARDFARLPLTAAKLSGLAPEADEARPLFDQVRPFLQEALEIFGADRLMVGSDWPVSAATPHALGYLEWFHCVRDLLPTEAERHSVMGGTAETVYLSGPRDHR